MAYKLYKLLGKKTASFLLVFTLIGGSFLPVFTPRAHAIFGFGDIVIDVKALARSIVDGIAMHLAQRMVDEMVKSTVTWAGSGFEGEPAFVTDPEKYFGQIADSVAGSYIESAQLAGLCTPFQANIRISLARTYVEDSYVPQCTLTGVVDNLENFYESFESGGWESWIQVTQNDANNPIGAYLDASSDLEKLIAERTGQEQLKLEWGDGFRSKGDCLFYNPANMDDLSDLLPEERNMVDRTKPAGACVRYGPDKTPGSIIKSQIDNVLPSGLEKLIGVEHVEQLISAFAAGVLQKYVFGPQGLAGTRPATTPTSTSPQPGGTTIYTPPSGQSENTCYADTTRAQQDFTVITWTYGGEFNPNYKYSWNFDPQANVMGEGAANFVMVTYNSPGIKRASITIDRNISLFPPQTISCANSVEVETPQQ